MNLLILGTQSFANGNSLTVVNKNNDELEIEVLDLNGNLVFSQKTTADLKISGSKFDSGVYLIVIIGEEGSRQTEKLIRY